MDNTQLTSSVNILPPEIIAKGGREFPEIGAFNATAWEYLLDTSANTVRKLIDDNSIPYKIMNGQRWLRPQELWEFVPWENAPKTRREK